MSGSDGSGKRLAEPETGVQISELSFDMEYVLLVFDAWHNIFFPPVEATFNERRQRCPIRLAMQRIAVLNKLTTHGLDTKTQAKQLSQNDHGMSFGRAHLRVLPDVCVRTPASAVSSQHYAGHTGPATPIASTRPFLEPLK